MQKSIVVEGKTSTEAIDRGLKELKCRREDVEIKILENEEKRSFYSILEPRVVKVELTLKNEVKSTTVRERRTRVATDEEVEKCFENIDLFLKDFSKLVGEIDYNINKNKDTLEVIISGENAKRLIGYRGETINALQNFLSAIGNKGLENRVRILVDIEEYKKRREKSLQELARKLEKTVRRNGKKVILEPMTSYERKIIHTELQDSEYVTTYSIGEEPRRKVVVDKKNK